jgi:hypothetical protein
VIIIRVSLFVLLDSYPCVTEEENRGYSYSIVVHDLGDA